MCDAVLRELRKNLPDKVQTFAIRLTRRPPLDEQGYFSPPRGKVFRGDPSSVLHISTAVPHCGEYGQFGCDIPPDEDGTPWQYTPDTELYAYWRGECEERLSTVKQFPRPCLRGVCGPITVAGVSSPTTSIDPSPSRFINQENFNTNVNVTLPIHKPPTDLRRAWYFHDHQDELPPEPMYPNVPDGEADGFITLCVGQTGVGSTWDITGWFGPPGSNPAMAANQEPSALEAAFIAIDAAQAAGDSLRNVRPRLA